MAKKAVQKKTTGAAKAKSVASPGKMTIAKKIAAKAKSAGKRPQKTSSKEPANKSGKNVKAAKSVAATSKGKKVVPLQPSPKMAKQNRQSEERPVLAGKKSERGERAGKKLSKMTAQVDGLGAAAPESSEPVRPSTMGSTAPDQAPKKGKRSRDLLDAVEKLSDLGAKWSALYERSKNIKAVTYSMTGQYEPRTPLVHKVLGWGFILSCQNNRVEVLFQDGVKVLISNYKG